MAALSRYLTPSTGDYVLEFGAPRSDATIASEVVLALRTRRGSAIGTPNFGSRLRQIRKLTPTNRRLADLYALEAIQYLVDRREVRSPKFTITISGQAMRIVVAYTNQARRDVQIPVTVPLT